MYESLLQLGPQIINFSTTDIHLVNAGLCVMMFGVALEIKISHFRQLVRRPAAALSGIFSQMIAHPAVTFMLIVLFNRHLTPTVAMGLILMASCPGGNISNFMSAYAGANTELAVELTATNTLLATVSTPPNFAFWGGLYNQYINNHAGNFLVKPLMMDTFQVFETVFILLGLPLFAGIVFSRYLPRIALRMKKTLNIASLCFFVGMVILAFLSNIGLFIQHITFIFIIVLIHNTTGLLTGYSVVRLSRLGEKDRRTLTIETGIYNSCLGLLLLFNPTLFAPYLAIGAMLFVVAWWGIWHIVSGVSLATFWHYKTLITENN